MEKEEITDFLGGLLGAFIAVLGVMSILSIFENDSSKIVSKQGREFLSDEDKMKDIHKKIQDSETQNQHNAVSI
tara:strand:+ start:610 stop:831 length:222 start_codon:yes stop_codon:yes gene_type:complete